MTATEHGRFIAYPPIERHGVSGDRRPAAPGAPDRTLDWQCLPNYDGEVLFGALPDAARGFVAVAPPSVESEQAPSEGCQSGLLWSS